MALSEIEKLERRYAENPQGLTFAPLAEVHRKNGEVQRALDLLGPGLEIHPDYIPASIVLGRCHMDLGDVHAAETAFLHVLALDGENVIALKALADISERLLKFDDAERWLRTLLIGGPQQRRRAGAAPAGRDRPAAGGGRLLGRAVEQWLDAAGRRPSASEAAAAPSAPPAAVEPPVAEPASASSRPVARAGRSAGYPSRAGPRWTSARVSSTTWSRPTLRTTCRAEPAGCSSRSREAALTTRSSRSTGLVGREVDTPDEPRRVPGRDQRGHRPRERRAAASSRCRTRRRSCSPTGPRRERAPFEEDAPVPPPRAEGSAEPREPAEAAPSPAVGARGRRSPPRRSPPRAGAARSAELEPPIRAAEPSRRAGAAPDAPGARRCRAARARCRRSHRRPRAAPEPIGRALTAATTATRAGPTERPEHGVRVAPPSARMPRARPAAARSPSSSRASSSARPPRRRRPPAVRQAPAARRRRADPSRGGRALAQLGVRRGGTGHAARRAGAAAPAAGRGLLRRLLRLPGRLLRGATPRAPDPKNDDLDQFHAWLQNLKR